MLGNEYAKREEAYLNQLRAREDIRGYHKFVDNAKLNNPDPTSSHFASSMDRHQKDFAQYDKDQRQQENALKN